MQFQFRGAAEGREGGEDGEQRERRQKEKAERKDFGLIYYHYYYNCSEHLLFAK